MHHFLLQHALPQPLLHIPPLFAGKRQGGDVSVDEDIRFSSCAQLNTRRLWNAGTVHAAFHGLADILLQLSINVVCIQETQETHAPDFASLPGDQPFVYDGPSNTGGCEAGFLFHESIRVSTVPGVTNTQRIRWRLVSGLVCVCSLYAPHIGVDDQFRSLFWQELVASVKHTQWTLPDTPIILSGDANVWWPEFHLGRERPRDRFIFPYIRELLEGCGLSLRNPLRVPRTSLELRSTRCSFRRSVAEHLMPNARNHFLCQFSFPAVRHASVPADTFPVVRDWEPILLAARTELDSWAVAVQESSSEDVVGLPSDVPRQARFLTI